MIGRSLEEECLSCGKLKVFCLGKIEKKKEAKRKAPSSPSSTPIWIPWSQRRLRKLSFWSFCALPSYRRTVDASVLWSGLKILLEWLRRCYLSPLRNSMVFGHSGIARHSRICALVPLGWEPMPAGIARCIFGGNLTCYWNPGTSNLKAQVSLHEMSRQRNVKKKEIPCNEKEMTTKEMIYQRYTKKTNMDKSFRNQVATLRSERALLFLHRLPTS